MQYNEKLMSDTDLIEGIRNRESAAFRFLYKNYTGTIRNFVKTHGGQDNDAEEIEQNVIIHLYEKIIGGTFVLNNNAKLSTYMFAVGKNMWFKKLRQESKTLLYEWTDESVEEIDFYNDYSQNTLEMEVIHALQHSDDDCRKILTMYYYDRRSMREIADMLGTISEENLRKRKYKCIQKLKRVLMDKIKSHG